MFGNSSLEMMAVNLCCDNLIHITITYTIYVIKKDNNIVKINIILYLDQQDNGQITIHVICNIKFGFSYRYGTNGDYYLT